MTHQYRFSIVIPTRNRSATLRFSIDTCLDQRGFEDYEIVVQDNGDDDETERLVARLIATDTRAASRIKYHRRGDPCSMARNFEEAIARASGEYIIVIGDDDGLMPMALWELDNLARQSQASVIRWRNGVYTWPDLTFRNSENYLGFCLLRALRVANGRAELVRSLEAMSYYELPMLYINAAVHRGVIDAARDREGRLFRSRSPDVYSAMVLAVVCGDYLDVTVPFTLAGVSAASRSVSAVFGGDNPEPRLDFRNLNAKDGIALHPYAPNVANPLVDVVDSFYQAKAHRFPDDNDFELPRRRVVQAFIERCNVQAPLLRDEVLRTCQDDAEILAFAENLIREHTMSTPIAPIRPPHLGADGANLHLDATDFEITTIKDAVALVHKIVWPGDAPLRYDLQGG